MQLNKIKHRRGLDANLPAGGTEAGELRYSTDLKKLYIDDGIANVLLATNEVATGMNSVVKNAIDTKNPIFTGISEATPIYAEDISIDTSSRVLTITPSLGYFDFYVGTGGAVSKYTKTGAVNFPAFNDTNGVWYFYFDASGNPLVSQIAPTSYTSAVMVYRIYWNSTLTGSAKLVICSLEAHSNSIPADDHEWKHLEGTKHKSGFDPVHNRIASAAPNADGSNTVFAMTSGTNIDDNLTYTVTNGTASTLFTQDLGNTSAASLNATNAGMFEIRTNDVNGVLQVLPATRFPFPWDSATDRPEFITTTGVRTKVSSGNFFVCFLYALQEPRTGKSIKVVPSYQEYSTIENAQACTWEEMRSIYPTLADNEIRPLYKLIFEYKSAYNTSCKYSALRQVDDLRKTKVMTSSSIGGAILATSVIVTPSGGISSTNAQSALLELDAEKVSKVSASDNCIVRFDGTLGDIQNSLVTISDTGSLNVPVGQNFNINGVALKDVSETLTNKTINNPTITGTPTGITATHVGLGNVTNNAQVKKIASSTDNAIMRWDGATGDLPQDSLVTISDTGTVNIPTGQNYNINGVNLKDVSETLTNKTLTAPVLNTEITGTGITTTGEANKLIKTNSSGNILTSGKIGITTGASDASSPKSPIQIGNKANIFNGNGTVGANWLDLGYNIFFYNGAYRYTAGTGVAGDEASLLEISGGLAYYTAPAGVADATINATKRLHITKDIFQVPLLAGTGTRVVVADASGNLSASTKLLRGYITATSGSTTTVTLPETMPAATYMVLLTSDRFDYNGAMTMTTRDKLSNEFKIHYWAADEASATVSWLLVTNSM